MFFFVFTNCVLRFSVVFCLYPIRCFPGSFLWPIKKRKVAAKRKKPKKRQCKDRWVITAYFNVMASILIPNRDAQCTWLPVLYSSCHPLNLRWQSYHDTALNDTPRNISDFAKLRGNQRIGYRQKLSENLNTQFAKTKKLQHFEDEYSSTHISCILFAP